MTWLHPLLLGGLVAAALPILIHLIGKRRAPIVHFAAMDFLLVVNKRLARREKLRQFLLLLLRTLAIAALVMAVARPSKPRAQAVANDNFVLVLVLDTSASMNAVVNGQSILERAKTLAKNVITRLQPGQPATLVLAGAELSAPVQAATIDHPLLMQSIDAIEAGEGVADMAAAIELGLAHAGETDSGATVVVVGDLSANSFSSLGPLKSTSMPRMRFIDAAARNDRQPLPNLAIANIAVHIMGPTQQTIEVQVRNFGSAPVLKRSLAIELDGVEVQRGYIDVPSQARAEKTLTLKLKTPGVFRATLKLDPGDDVYAADNEASVLVHAVPAMQLLLVNGDPRTVPYEDELFFLGRALEALPRGASPIEVTSITLDECAAFADAENGLQGFNAIVLAHAKPIDLALRVHLEEFVKSGGGLLLTLGDRVNFEKLNDSLGPLLVSPLRDLFRAKNTREGSPAVAIGTFDVQHTVLRSLDENVIASLKASRTASYFNLAAGVRSGVRNVLRFQNGAPALLERRWGQGVLMLWTSSIDRDLTDIPLRTAFVPLMQGLMRYLGGYREPLRAGVVRSGGEVNIPVPTGATHMAVVFPDGKRHEYSVNQDRSALALLRFDSTEQLGWYSLETKQDRAWLPAPELSFAVASSLDESDFMAISDEELNRRMRGDGEDTQDGLGFVFLGSTSDDMSPFDIRGYASYFLLALGLLFFAESMLAARG